MTKILNTGSKEGDVLEPGDKDYLRSPTTRDVGPTEGAKKDDYLGTVYESSRQAREAQLAIYRQEDNARLARAQQKIDHELDMRDIRNQAEKAKLKQDLGLTPPAPLVATNTKEHVVEPKPKIASTEQAVAKPKTPASSETSSLPTAEELQQIETQRGGIPVTSAPTSEEVGRINLTPIMLGVAGWAIATGLVYWNTQDALWAAIPTGLVVSWGILRMFDYETVGLGVLVALYALAGGVGWYITQPPNHASSAPSIVRPIQTSTPTDNVDYSPDVEGQFGFTSEPTEEATPTETSEPTEEATPTPPNQTIYVCGATIINKIVVNKGGKIISSGRAPDPQTGIPTDCATIEMPEEE